ncbi:MAG: hypothetical protein QN168_04145 [Armatimonadota bacterium]|nr:hypothetical protein [Armatimonadota bacterium]
MRRQLLVLALCVPLTLGVIAPAVLGHQTKVVGGKYRVIVGFVREPAFTDERNGLDLIVRRVEDNAPVEHLERSLSAELIAPGGQGRRALRLRPQFGRPGYYTDDFILTRPGVYQIRVWGVIADVRFDETFESHEVRPLSELRFP